MLCLIAAQLLEASEYRDKQEKQEEDDATREKDVWLAYMEWGERQGRG